MNEETDPIKKIINESGNTLHYEIVNILRAQNWVLDVSPYFVDSATGKSREVDIIAKKIIKVDCSEQKKNIGEITLKLFIECKYINQDIVFWLDNKDEKKNLKLVNKYFGLKENQKWPIQKKHRYVREGSVAKLFAGNGKQDCIHKALDQTLRSLIYYRESSIDNQSRESGDKITKEIHYPIIILNSFINLHRVYTYPPKNLKIHEEIKNNFMLDVNYAYMEDKNDCKIKREEDFIIDIVSKDTLSNFLLEEIEEKDVKELKENIYLSYEQKEGEKNLNSNNNINKRKPRI